MYEIILKDGTSAFQGYVTAEEANEYCETHDDWDMVLNVGDIEAEKMMAQGYTWDSWENI